MIRNVFVFKSGNICMVYTEGRSTPFGINKPVVCEKSRDTYLIDVKDVDYVRSVEEE